MVVKIPMQVCKINRAMNDLVNQCRNIPTFEQISIPVEEMLKNIYKESANLRVSLHH